MCADLLNLLAFVRAQDESVHVSAATPTVLRCQTIPNRTLEHGRFPDSCQGMAIGDPCLGYCDAGWVLGSYI